MDAPKRVQKRSKSNSYAASDDSGIGALDRIKYLLEWGIYY